MKTTDEMLEKVIECLWQTDQLTVIDHERGEFSAAVAEQSHLIVLHRVACDGRRFVEELVGGTRLGETMTLVLARMRTVRRGESRVGLTYAVVLVRHDVHAENADGSTK